MKLLIIYAHFPEQTESSSLLSFIIDDLKQRGVEYQVCNIHEILSENTNIPIQSTLSMKLPEIIISCQNQILEADKVIVLTSSNQGSIPKDLNDYIDYVFTEEFMFNLISGGKPTYKCDKEFGIISSNPSVEKLIYITNNYESVEFPYQRILKNLNAILKFNILIPKTNINIGLDKESSLEIRNAIECLIDSCSPYIPGKFPNMSN